MQYMGGKVRIAKYLVPVLQERLKDNNQTVFLMFKAERPKGFDLSLFEYARDGGTCSL